MGTTFQIGSGNKVFVYVSLLPLGVRVAPTDVPLTLADGVTSGATNLTVSATSGAIAGGTPIDLTNGTNTITVVASADAPAGSTSIPIIAAASALSGSSTGTVTAKQRLLAGTKLSVEINSDNTDVLVFEDTEGYKDGAITAQSWQIPWEANLIPTDEGLQRVRYAALNAISGREVWVWQQDPAPPGFTTGNSISGPCAVMNYKEELPSNGIITVGFTLMGRGTPTFAGYSNS